MANYLLDHTLDAWGDWATASHYWMLLRSDFVQDRTDHYVADLVAYEVGVAGYARQAVTGEVRSVDTTNHRVSYSCDDVTFAGLAAGETIGWAVIYKVVTNDSDHLLLCVADLTNTPTSDGTIILNVGAEINAQNQIA